MTTVAAMNPYVVGRIVTGERCFFGRATELQRLRSAFLQSVTPPHVSIVGETRSGKSSLIMEFLRRNEASLHEQICVVPLDVSIDFEKGSTQGFYQQLAAYAVDAVSESRGDVETFAPGYREALKPGRWGVVQSRLRRLFRNLSNKGVQLLFVLDEFDYAPELFVNDSQAFKVLRIVGQESNISFIVASRREIADIENDAGISSNFAGIFDLQPIYMPLLNSDDARQLCLAPLKPLGRVWADEVVNELKESSGGHACLLQGLCHQLFREAWQLSMAEQLERLAAFELEIFRRLFEIMAVRLRRTGLYDALIELLGGNSLTTPPEKAEELVRLRYLKPLASGVYAPFSPLLSRVCGLSEPVLEERISVKELLAGWGIQEGVCNVVVEGETDREYLQIAAIAHHEKTGQNLVEGIHIVPGGFGRRGGVRPVARRLITVHEAAQGSGIRVLALLDLDRNGQRIAKALESLGFENRKKYLLLDRKHFPIRKYDGEIEVEIEDLLSTPLQEAFAEDCPDAVEEILDRKKQGIRFRWKGSHKDRMVEFMRREAQHEDLGKLIELLIRIRQAFGLKAETFEGQQGHNRRRQARSARSA